MIADVLGRPMAVELSAGNVADISAVSPELLRLVGRGEHLLADKGYDADALRRTLRVQGAIAVIPGRCNRKRKIPLDKARYRQRWRIEAAFGRLKDFRRVATRYDKLAANVLSAVTLAAVVALWC